MGLMFTNLANYGAPPCTNRSFVDPPRCVEHCLSDTAQFRSLLVTFSNSVKDRKLHNHRPTTKGFTVYLFGKYCSYMYL